MVKVAGLLAVLGCSAAVGCGSDTQATGDQGAAGSTSGGSGSGGGSAQGGSTNTGGSGQVIGASDAGAPSGIVITTLADLDAPCTAGGPTGRQLLAFVQVPYAGTYSPPTSRPAAHPWTGSMMPVPLTVGIKYDAGPIVCTVDNYSCPPGAPCRVIPPPTVSVDVDLSFKTADGLLDEIFPTTVRYAIPANQWTQFDAFLPATKIKGTFPIATGAPDQAKLQFQGRFDGTKYSGTIEEDGQVTSVAGGSWLETPVGAADASSDR